MWNLISHPKGRAQIKHWNNIKTELKEISNEDVNWIHKILSLANES